jgi:hypothetical protein
MSNARVIKASLEKRPVVPEHLGKKPPTVAGNAPLPEPGAAILKKGGAGASLRSWETGRITGCFNSLIWNRHPWLNPSVLCNGSSFLT